MTLFGAPLLLCALVAAEEKPVPKVPIGKETTVATGPLDKEGYIIYETALNERLGKGVTADRNANVLLWKALGPRPEGGKRGMPAEFFKQLGSAEPPEKGDYFIDLGRHLQENATVTKDELQAVLDQQGWASQRPWAARDYPHIAAWLTANEKPLAVVIEASKRPDYFNPLASHSTGEGPGGLIASLLPGVQKCRSLASALTARAMLRVQEGKLDEAWQDLLACHRLARLIRRGATLIESLVGIALEAVVCNTELAYLDKAKLTAAQVRDRLKDLQTLPPMVPLADKVDLGERFMFLDCMQMVRKGGIGAMEVLTGGPAARKLTEKELKALDLIDWDPAFRNGNVWYDRMVAAMRVKDRAEREKQLDKVEVELKALKTTVIQPDNLLKLLMAMNPDKEVGKTVGKAIGDVMVTLLIPAVRKVGNAGDRIAQVYQNQQVAFAMAAYRLENGRYPAKLDELAPKYLPAVPGDLFSGKALIYRPEGRGYLFYSFGVNGKDDGGRWSDDEPPGDDLRVRMPLPELKKK